jgi:hypothetical protein
MVQNIVKYILLTNILWNLNLSAIAFGLLRALLIIGGVALLVWLLWEIQSVLFYIGIAAAIS